MGRLTSVNRPALWDLVVSSGGYGVGTNCERAIRYYQGLVASEFGNNAETLELVANAARATFQNIAKVMQDHGSQAGRYVIDHFEMDAMSSHEDVAVHNQSIKKGGGWASLCTIPQKECDKPGHGYCQSCWTRPKSAERLGDIVRQLVDSNGTWYTGGGPDRSGGSRWAGGMVAPCNRYKGIAIVEQQP